MRFRTFFCVLLAVTAAAEPPATQPANLSERQASILLQLSNAEANIKAINKALTRTGYKVGLAYEQKQGSEKANELMDRKGGGPVPWDQFYGKTAMSFYHHASADLHINQGRGAAVLDAQWTGSRLTKIDRPAQFDSIYKANDQQSARAQEQIATLLQDQAALLARRQKHEADQSSLWAQLALEQVSDREIAFRPLYRFSLTPPGPRAGLLRGPILFLRTTDKLASEALKEIESDQPGAFVDLRQRARDAFTALQDSTANALVIDGVKPEDAKEATWLKAMCKSIAEQCVVIDDNFRRALDSDKAKEDASKLQYREALQASLAKLATETADLDDRLTELAATWGVTAQPGTASPDPLPTFPPRLSVSPPPVAQTSPPAPTAVPPPTPPVVNGAPRAALLFAARPHEIAVAKEMFGNSVKVIAQDDTADALAVADPFANVQVVCWGQNRWKEFAKTPLPKPLQTALQKFVKDGGDLIFYEQFSAYNTSVLKDLFGIKIRGTHQQGIDVVPAMTSKAAALKQDLTEVKLGKITCWNTYDLLPDKSIELAHTTDDHAVAGVIVPFGRGRLILLGVNDDAPNLPFVLAALHIAYDR